VKLFVLIDRYAPELTGANCHAKQPFETRLVKNIHPVTLTKSERRYSGHTEKKPK